MRRKVIFGFLLGVVGLAALGLGLVAPRETASAAMMVGPLYITSAVDANGRGVDSRIEFYEDNDGFWVVVPYSDLPPGTVLTRVVRFGGTDFNWDSDQFGYLNCCPNGGTGSLSFRVLQYNGSAGELPGGSYQVSIYANGTEVASIGAGI